VKTIIEQVDHLVDNMDPETASQILKDNGIETPKKSELTKADKQQIIALVNGEISATDDFLEYIASDFEAYKFYMLRNNKRKNQKLSWRERISRKTLSDSLDAANTPEALAGQKAYVDAFQPTMRPLQDIVADMLAIAEEEFNPAHTQTFIDLNTELFLRDIGLHDLIGGLEHISPEAQERIAKLQGIIDDIFNAGEHRLRNAILDRVPELHYMELDSVFSYVRHHAPRQFHGEVTDGKALSRFVAELIISESKRRILLHQIVSEHSGAIYRAIDRQLDRISDFYPSYNRQDIFSEVIVLILERFIDSLAEQGTAKISTRLYKLATEHARIHVKEITDHVAIERLNPGPKPGGIFPKSEPEFEDCDE
jgi:hypothetical protein